MSVVESHPWLSGVRPSSGASLRLFCFPYAGASARVFASWADGLAAPVQVCPVEYPGRGSRMRESACRSLGDLTRMMLEGMAGCFDSPFAFFGHSMGALVAFELTHLLRARLGVQPAALLVSGCRGPQVSPREDPTYSLPDDPFVEALRVLNGTPAAVLESREALEFLMPILRADFEVVQTYRYEARPKLSIPLAAFGGTADSHVLECDLDAWRDMTTARFTRDMLSGSHFFLNESQPALLTHIAAVLASASSTRSSCLLARTLESVAR